MNTFDSMSDKQDDQLAARLGKKKRLAWDASSTQKKDEDLDKPLPKGVVLDKDGKPCRLCTSVASWRALTKQASSASSSSNTSSSSSPTLSPPSLSDNNASSIPGANDDDCPPDVEALGRSTWTFLHSLTAAYPPRATSEQQLEMHSFLKLFSRLYPCWVCADDFRAWMNQSGGRNEPRLSGRSEFGTWMCEAHNAVNRKLGKKEFDCRFWEERWRTGWKDGRCD
ncbi:hypothetical protein Egran_01436 [Elaphomyces granulatus]|uniref:Sulfhydryl oxidase n=1 Tax=Elaphomyces granulatus TaxID=519963 RepID=A0A232M3C8_9EURO|nr:hypothetical protein Egran_01436 [Elaphomyces granulatus]